MLNGKSYTGSISGGAWSVTVPVADAALLAESSHTITADVSDAAGNAATQATHNITVDKTPPAISGNDVALTNDATPDLSGTTDVADGTSVTVTNSSNATVCTTTAGGGNWSCTPASPLPAGNNTLTVATTDPSGNTSTDGFTAVINHQPTITSNSGNPLTLEVAENTTSVSDVEATDSEDGAETNLTYTLSGADAAKFSIGTDGKLAFIAAPDFETPASANASNLYQVTVTTTDKNGGMDTQAITVTVTDVDDTAPVITIGTAGQVPIILLTMQSFAPWGSGRSGPFWAARSPSSGCAAGSIAMGRTKMRQTPLQVVVTFHPRFLLKNEELKKAAWQDLQMIQRRLRAS